MEISNWQMRFHIWQNKLWASAMFYIHVDLSVSVMKTKTWLLIGKVSGQNYLSLYKWDKRFEGMHFGKLLWMKESGLAQWKHDNRHNLYIANALHMPEWVSAQISSCTNTPTQNVQLVLCWCSLCKAMIRCRNHLTIFPLIVCVMYKK